MAALIRRGITTGTPAAEVSREEWPELVELRRMFCKRALPGDCRLLLDFIEDGRYCAFLGYADEETYIREGLGLDPEAVSWAIRGLELTGSEVPVSFADAVHRGRSASERINAAAMVTTGEVHPPHRTKEDGNLPPSLEERAGSSGVSKSTQQRLDALARRAPELLDEVRAGRMSTHAAAKKAGIVREKPPIEHLRTWWRKASEAERAAFREEIDTPVMDARFG